MYIFPVYGLKTLDPLLNSSSYRICLLIRVLLVPNMVGSTPPKQIQPPSSSMVATASTEEEAMKRNTDCVYFLASPLICKKVWLLLFL